MFPFRKSDIVFSFVILTWNRSKFLDLCLENLISSISGNQKAEILVFDNGSTDHTEDVVQKYPVVTYRKLKKNYGLNAYKRLINAAAGTYIIIVDDDVIEFPPAVDQIFLKYMTEFHEFGYVAMNVVQNELTNGAKPGAEFYKDFTRNNLTLEEGPTGGWLACLRREDYLKIRFRFWLKDLSFRNSDDGVMVKLMKKRLNLRCGIIKDHTCLHACGPIYAKQFGHLDREIEKYKRDRLGSFVDQYEKMKSDMQGNQ